jgi:hypothetical protein
MTVQEVRGTVAWTIPVDGISFASACLRVRLRDFLRGPPIDAFGHTRRQGRIRQRRRVYMAIGLHYSMRDRFCAWRMRQDGAFSGDGRVSNLASAASRVSFIGRRRAMLTPQIRSSGIFYLRFPALLRLAPGRSGRLESHRCSGTS